jgi:hypothetical protein
MDSTVSLSASQGQAAAQALNDLIAAKDGDPISPEEQATAVAAAVDARTEHEDELHQAQEQSKLDAAGLEPEAAEAAPEAEQAEDEAPADAGEPDAGVGADLAEEDDMGASLDAILNGDDSDTASSGE